MKPSLGTPQAGINRTAGVRLDAISRRVRVKFEDKGYFRSECVRSWNVRLCAAFRYEIVEVLATDKQSILEDFFQSI